MRAGSQCARLLAVLRDGPATNREVHERAGHMIVNSRCAELRGRGYVIECEYVGGTGAAAYLYTLLSEPGSASAASPGSESSDAHPLGAETEARGGRNPLTPRQALANGEPPAACLDGAAVTAASVVRADTSPATGFPSSPAVAGAQLALEVAA